MDPILAPKGVSKTEFGYRVQLNVPNPNKTPAMTLKNRKFSRNAKTFAEALWLYEIAILISDSHCSLADMIDGGNYRSLYSMKVGRVGCILCVWGHAADIVVLCVGVQEPGELLQHPGTGDHLLLHQQPAHGGRVPRRAAGMRVSATVLLSHVDCAVL